MSKAEEEKTPEQLEQEEAAKKLTEMLDTTRPKNLREGVGSGVSNIVGGAVGGVGILVLAPTVGLAAGARSGGVLGGIVGVTGGAVVGVIAAPVVALIGGVSGVAQVFRGIAAAPAAISAPMHGKWWNENEGKWVSTDLPKSFTSIMDKPEDDEDLLGGIQKEVDAGAKPGEAGEVKETYYYDVLEVAPNAEPSAIKRRYYVLARKYHPDKVGKEDKEAADKFKDIAEAYQVLCDADLRAQYDKEGREGLSADKTGVAESAPQVDAATLFAFLFGSDQFSDYVGRLATATSASVGDSPNVSMEVAKELQKRREIRLAVKLAARLDQWVAGDTDTANVMWASEAEELCKASFGHQLIQLIGKVYNLAAVKFLGSYESGIGMPSISRWADRQKANMAKSSDSNKAKMKTLSQAMEMMQMQQKLQQELEEAKTDEERAAIQAKLEDAMSTTMLHVLWTTTSVDITNTLYTVVKMVCFDKSVDKKVRLKRAEGIKQLGQVLMDCPAPAVEEGEESKDAKKLYEEAAFAAMLDTIKRKEEAQTKAASERK